MKRFFVYRRFGIKVKNKQEVVDFLTKNGFSCQNDHAYEQGAYFEYSSKETKYLVFATSSNSSKEFIFGIDLGAEGASQEAYNKWMKIFKIYSGHPQTYMYADFY